MGVKKMGHGGTLDPLASGLMIIGVEKGTKRLNDFLKLSKVYEAEVLLGIKTTTGDMEGAIIEQKPVEAVSLDEIQKILQSMVGKLTLPVPAYSAIKIAGKPLYKYARQHLDVGRPSKEMEIFWIKLRSYRKLCVLFPPLKKGRSGGVIVETKIPPLTPPCKGGEKERLVISIELEVASGTYIRSIAEEIGHRLGYPATIKELRRTKIGEFKIEDAQVLE
jgi:tRNA pseudouridine55 synthase